MAEVEDRAVLTAAAIAASIRAISSSLTISTGIFGKPSWVLSSSLNGGDPERESAIFGRPSGMSWGIVEQLPLQSPYS